MENTYEVIGNKIKFYLKSDPMKGWNQIPSPQFRTSQEIAEWCRSSTNELMCQWDALNQNAMSATDTTDFLYRWISWYVTEPLNGTAREIRKLPDELANVLTNVPVDTFELIKNTSHKVLDCIYIALDWIPQLLTILFSRRKNMFKRKETISFQSFMNQSYKKKKQTKIYSIGYISPLAFFHMSQPLVHTYLALGILGGLTIGAVLLEKYLVRNDHMFPAKLVSEGLYYGVRIGVIGFIGYVFIRILMML
jgi:hypothetical protein